MAATQPTEMKIASFNVNSLRARMPIVLEWLAKVSPDALCLQETKVQDADFPGDFFLREGPSADVTVSGAEGAVETLVGAEV